MSADTSNPKKDPKEDNISGSDSLQKQGETDRLIDYVNEQIELLAFDEPDPALLEQMVQCLADSRRRARVRLVDAFCEIGEAATPVLLKGIETAADPTVRVACCNALTNIGDADAVPGLVVALRNDENINVKGAAAAALAKLGAPAFAPLKAMLADAGVSESCKGQAAWAIASMSSEVSEQLYASMSDSSAAVRTAMVGAIAGLAQSQLAQSQLVQSQLVQSQQNKGPTTPSQSEPSTTSKPLSILIEALADPSSEVRIEATANLARLKQLAAYEPLVRGLNDAEPGVRKATILALGTLANPAAAEAISPLQQDPNPDVQRVATMVVTQLATR